MPKTTTTEVMRKGSMILPEEIQGG
ncbi:hypothetical protein A2U01_0082712, partial [Trifolium medium]|nr:hypothetical protein [Trifolium medium]